MKYLIVLLNILTSTTISFGQCIDDYLYRQANILFARNNFVEADSMYTLSLRCSTSKDAYFNRALARFRIKNLNGCCEDFFVGTMMGDKEAEKYYWKYCARIDTLCFDRGYENSNLMNTTYLFEIVKRNLYNQTLIIEKYNHDYKMVISYKVNSLDTFYLGGTDFINPNFPGGDNELFSFLAKEVKYPANLRENGVMGTIYASFIIDQMGKCNSFNIVNDGNPQLEEEFLRVLRLMPSWKAGIYGGRNVKVEYHLPIKFSLR